MKNFRDLKAWAKAHALALLCYEETKPYPEKKSLGWFLRFAGLVHQSLQTLRKVVAGEAMPNSIGFYRWPWVLPTNLNITYFYPGILAT